MATVTRDIRKAKKWVCVGRNTIRDEKRCAHRAHRRAWSNYLQTVAKTGRQKDGLEIDLDKPRLTSWDIS